MELVKAVQKLHKENAQSPWSEIQRVEEITRKTKEEVGEMRKELTRHFSASAKIGDLEQQLMEAIQQKAAYENQSFEHGKKIEELQDLLQKERNKAANLQRNINELSQTLQNEREKISKRCTRPASDCDKAHRKLEKRETSKAEKQKNDEIDRLRTQMKKLEDEKKKLSESLQQLERVLEETRKAEKQKNDELERFKTQAKKLENEKQTLSQSLQQLEHVLESPECHRPRCVQLEQQIKEQQKTIEKVSPMKNMAWQYDGEHDQLKREYEELMTNPDGILGQLEEEFADSFDAKIVLTGIFMTAYKESVKSVMKFVVDNLRQLFMIQTKPDVETENFDQTGMDDLSRAFGLLLHSTAAKSRLTHVAFIPRICKKVEGKISELEPIKRLQKQIPKLPLEKVVELTLKFVTLPNPLIACQPTIFNPEIHSRDFEHWDPKQAKPFQLIYARPVVYRSHHGVLACKGLVGNEEQKVIESSVDS